MIDSAPYQRHSATSKASANEIIPHLGRLQHEVYRFLRRRGPYGATDEEMQIALDMNPSTQRPRRIELLDKQLIEGPEGFKRFTISKRKAQVWLINEKQLELV